MKRLGGKASFKFVISTEKDWDEIFKEYIVPGLVSRSQIILMPEGASWETLTLEKRKAVAELAMRHNVRYSERLQVNLYNTKTGV
jgi:hypothetical protein